MSLGSALTLGVLWLSVDLSVGVAPFDVLGLSDDDGAALRQLAAELSDDPRRHRRVAPLDDVDEAIEARSLDDDTRRACLQDGECAAEIARDARVDELLVGSAAGLGGTYVLRLTLVDAERGVVDEELQRTVSGGLDELRLALGEQIDRLMPRSRPWWRRWWPWTILGVAVATAAVVTAVLLTREDENPYDTYPLP